jgi:hypothetical protein
VSSLYLLKNVFFAESIVSAPVKVAKKTKAPDKPGAFWPIPRGSLPCALRLVQRLSLAAAEPAGLGTIKSDIAGKLRSKIAAIGGRLERIVSWPFGFARLLTLVRLLYPTLLN